jgi:hypothetical protein
MLHDRMSNHMNKLGSYGCNGANTRPRLAPTHASVASILTTLDSIFDKNNYVSEVLFKK